MKSLFLFHAGSYNHGCEAIVRSTLKILKDDPTEKILYSLRKSSDEKYRLNEIVEIRDFAKGLKYHSPYHIFSGVMARYFHLYSFQNRYYKDSIDQIDSDSIMFSIGGDNYCYGGNYKKLAYFNKLAAKKNAKSVLFGCSVDPGLLKKKEILEDMKRYSLITARETITYNALVEAGVTNARLVSDPAFQLDKVCLPLPEWFVESNTVGINISPYVQNSKNRKDSTYRNYVNLIGSIIAHSDMQVALLAHVEDDDELLNKLFLEFQHTNRVHVLGDFNCMELKGFISRMRFFIGARTHATIAAYSTYVPTLVVGYSVKARGIAKDIFGSVDHYVVPYTSLKDDNDLIKAFEWLQNNESAVKNHLQSVMPGYVKKALAAAEFVKELTNGKKT